MANVISGAAAGYSGKLGDVVYKPQPHGRPTTVSAVPIPSDKPATLKQLSFRMDTSIISNLMKVMKEFILIGYEVEARLTKQNPNNCMAPLLRKDALTGEYPERRVDFSKLLVGKGKMQTPQEAEAIVNEFGLFFTWNTDIKIKDIHYSDQIVLLAYFPESNEVQHRIGAQRREGKDILPLTGIKRGALAEVYISFVTDDRKGISDSVYLGQFTW